MIECNYLAILPPSVEEMSVRIIRNRILTKEALKAIEVEQRKQIIALKDENWGRQNRNK